MAANLSASVCFPFALSQLPISCGRYAVAAADGGVAVSLSDYYWTWPRLCTGTEGGVRAADCADAGCVGVSLSDGYDLGCIQGLEEVFEPLMIQLLEVTKARATALISARLPVIEAVAEQLLTSSCAYCQTVRLADTPLSPVISARLPVMQAVAEQLFTSTCACCQTGCLAVSQVPLSPPLASRYTSCR